jgi:hypothetical protein
LESHGGLSTIEQPVVTGVEQMVVTLKGRNYTGLDLTFDKFDGETHVSVFGGAISRGLRAVSQG